MAKTRKEGGDNKSGDAGDNTVQPQAIQALAAALTSAITAAVTVAVASGEGGGDVPDRTKYKHCHQPVRHAVVGFGIKGG